MLGHVYDEYLVLAKKTGYDSPPPGLPCMLWSPLIRSVLSFEESVLFDPSGNPVLLVFL
jgi:hypothetical protein